MTGHAHRRHHVGHDTRQRPEDRRVAPDEPLDARVAPEAAGKADRDDRPERIQQRTGGNPFFIEEVVKSLIEQQRLGFKLSLQSTARSMFYPAGIILNRLNLVLETLGHPVVEMQIPDAK